MWDYWWKWRKMLQRLGNPPHWEKVIGRPYKNIYSHIVVKQFNLILKRPTKRGHGRKGR